MELSFKNGGENTARNLLYEAGRTLMAKFGQFDLETSCLPTHPININTYLFLGISKTCIFDSSGKK